MYPTIVIFKLDAVFFAKQEMAVPPSLGDVVTFPSGSSGLVVKREWKFESHERATVYIDLKGEKKRRTKT